MTPRAATVAPMAARRTLFAALVGTSILGLVGLMVAVFAGDGLVATEIVLLVLFAANTPWLVIGFWNAVIGFIIIHAARDPVQVVAPLTVAVPDATTLVSWTAIVVPIRNEDPLRSFARIAAEIESLKATGAAAAFEVFILSDTDEPAVAAAEEDLFADLNARMGQCVPLHYRRRSRNTGFKAGNLRDFCETHGPAFDFMIVLDADSLMTGSRLVELVRTMEANPSLGILQTLVVGLPALSPFARIFQFGMRHGMRVYTMGSAWWQGDAGPYWGHNAIIRLAPFIEHCRLPALKGQPPFGGPVLSHDQLEAALMRRAGYEVRVVPVEDGSFEENPPTLPDFLKRDLRWCQGNLQYVQLLARPGFSPMGRLQLVLAILMYTAAPLWLGFLLVGFGQLLLMPAALPEGAVSTPVGQASGINIGLVLYAAVMLMVMTPKILGIIDVLVRRRSRLAYGGAARILLGALVELVFGLLLGAAVAVTHAIFIGGLLLGKQVTWSPQKRASRAITLKEAFAGLWPQLVLGIAAWALLQWKAPAVIPWATPILAGWLFAVPFACMTSWRAIGLRLARWGVCAVPEEIDPPHEIRRMNAIAAALQRNRGAANGSGRTSAPQTKAAEMVESL
ncbi:MAG: glucans biosynthesis glucosyltransferase MdoH [Defluviicoccus sp.]